MKENRTEEFFRVEKELREWDNSEEARKREREVGIDERANKKRANLCIKIITRNMGGCVVNLNCV